MVTSNQLFEEAQQYIPGGVNSPVRAFKSVGGTPLFIEKAEGAYLYDTEGKKYIDYVGSWGPMILGHNNQQVLDAVINTAKKGLSFGTPSALEVKLAELVNQYVPSIEMLRMVNSGTEATMSAIRLARGYTGRDKIVKFEGCYHGHVDALLVQAGSGALTLGEPNSPGIPEDFTKHTLICQYNDIDSVKDVFEKYGDEIAGVIIEPVAGNMNCVPPKNGFLQGIRKLCDEYGSVFIIDEVMTGFRVARGGAQAFYNVKPDLTTLGKIIGGGMPVGAFGGKKEIMEYLAPLGPVYQAGTLAGNPVAMAAGIACLQQLKEPEVYEYLTEMVQKLTSGLEKIAQENGVGLTTNSAGAMFGIFFTDKKEVSTHQDVMACDTEKFKKFFHGMLNEGIYLAPSAFESSFMSLSHSDEHIDKTLEAASKVFANL